MSKTDELITCPICKVEDLPGRVWDQDPSVVRWECAHCGTVLHEEPLTVVWQDDHVMLGLAAGATPASLLAGSRTYRAAVQQAQQGQAEDAPGPPHACTHNATHILWAHRPRVVQGQ